MVHFTDALEREGAQSIPFSLAIGHQATAEVLRSVEKATGLKSHLVLGVYGAKAGRLASDDTVPSYDDPQPDPPTVPSYDDPQPDPPTVPSYDS